MLYPAMKTKTTLPVFLCAVAIFCTALPAVGGEMLEPGDAFPQFDLTAHDGTTVSSTDLRGRALLVYYYPKADTPG